MKVILLIGNPNVGKSVIFSLLSGKYNTVSNYPGTTVEFEEGEINIDNCKYKIIDTPGVNSLIPMSEDELVTRNLILHKEIYAILIVGDAKNLKRTLNLLFQIAEMGLPSILVLNMADEAQKIGIKINAEILSKKLGIPVIETVATRKKGLTNLIEALKEPKVAKINFAYESWIEKSISELEGLLPNSNISRRALALMLLSGDKELFNLLKERLAIEQVRAIENKINELMHIQGKDFYEIIQINRSQHIERIQKEVEEIVKVNEISPIYEKITMHPLWGYFILLIVLFAMYIFIGKFGAQIAVDYLEEIIFNKHINPWFTKLFLNYIGNNLISDFFIGKYGILTMALTYGIAIIMPIVLTFFIAMGILEDSGYLPRLSILLNKIFKWMGLNGKAVIPMILGLGCDTMATMTTRILDTKKERILVTLLLALGVPCSAQLSVIFAMVAKISTLSFSIWLIIICLVLIIVGYLGSKVIAGESSDFILEIPPLRIPQFSNVFIKTLARLEWYSKEVIPLFVISTAALFLLDKVKILKIIEDFSSPLVVNLLNLPKEAAGAFLMGFLRRDYGAAGLFDLFNKGSIDDIGALVSMVTITLFIPCFANTLMIIKERGLKLGLTIIAIIFPLSFLVGALLNAFLRGFHIIL